MPIKKHPIVVSFLRIRPICRGWIRPIELSPVLLSLNQTEQIIQYDHKYKNYMLLSVYKFIGWRPSGL